jgi:hypothetical protein
MTQTSDTPLAWTPKTDSSVPQPAGHQCADWYAFMVPDAETILYALAHTKGDVDRLERSLAKANADRDALKEALEGMCQLAERLDNKQVQPTCSPAYRVARATLARVRS